MRFGEDLRVLLTQSDQVRDGEEAAVVDFAGGTTPVREAVGLSGEQAAKPPRSVAVRGEGGQGGIDVFAHLRRGVVKNRETVDQLRSAAPPL